MNPTNGTVLKPPGPPPPTLAEAAARSGPKLRHAAIVAALLLIAATLAGLIPRWHHQANLRAETAQLLHPTVTVVSPHPGQAALGLMLPAEVKPFLEAPIYARGSGYLKRWLVDIGAQVKEGDLLAEIDIPELNQELEQARAQLVQAEAASELARTTAARWAELLKTASVSEQEAAEKKADLELKQANVEAARANVRRLADLQSFESVRAPFPGIITERNTDVGELISTTKELFRLAQTSTLRVYVRVPETVAPTIAAGQTAELTLPDQPGRPFPAKVVRTSGVMSADSRTLLTELQVDNPRNEILSGSYAQVRFTDTRPQALLTLPSNTLLFRAEGPQVGVVNADGRVELHNVTLGRDFGPSIEIVSGVAPTDRVILNPADSLVSGVTVTVSQRPGSELSEK